MKRASEFLVLVAMLLVTAIVSVFAASDRVAELEKSAKLDNSISCNQAMQMGFRIYDDAGFEVEHFDGQDYWTTEPRP